MNALPNTSACMLHIYPAVSPGVIAGVKVLTGVTCSLSILGACVIILTYVAFKDLRTTARQLLLNLSIADMLIAGSHFVGAMINFERFLPHYDNTTGELIGNLDDVYDRINESAFDAQCISQGAVTMFSTIASFLWTMSIAVYMLVMITTNIKQKAIKVMVVILYVLSWGVPIPFVIASIIKRFLGFQLTGQAGCYVVDYDYKRDDNIYIAAEVFTYEIWVYIAYIVLPISYIAVSCHIRCRKKEYSNTALASSKTDIKLLFIPVIFLLLRVWTTFVDVIAFYTRNFDVQYRCNIANAVLLFMQAIGINAQGFVNAVLFCLLTRQVRMRWYHVLLRLCRRKNDQVAQGQSETLLEDTLDLSTTNSLQTTHYGSIKNN